MISEKVNLTVYQVDAWRYSPVKPTFSWKRAAVFALAGMQIISAQTPKTAAAAATGIIPIGSTLTFGGTNAPDTYSATNHLQFDAGAGR
jgi:hypothetical protein